MSYETISVRMNRSDASIRWGFTLRRSNDKVVVATVERDSLSEKAGLREGDEVETVCGRSAKGMDVNEASRIVENAQFEVNFSMRRFVTSHTCLPWTLTEKDNKLMVDEMKPGFGSGFGQGMPAHGTQFHSPGARSVPMQQVGPTQHNSSSFSSSQQNQNRYMSSPVQQHNIVHSPNTQYSAQNTSSYSRTETGNKPGNGYVPSSNSYSTHNYTTGTNYAPPQSGNYASPQSGNYAPPPSGNYAPPQSGNASTNFNNRATSFASDYGNKSVSNGNAAPAANYSFNNGATTTSYTGGTGGVPLNQNAFIQTQHSPGAVGAVHGSSLSPGGTRVFYHSPSARSRRDLSPNASVKHLQYNSPMNLYSVDTAAEQFTQQTGRNIDAHGRPTAQSPAYLNSETKKIIEEQEGRLRRGLSPSTQSSSFKRISQAVGAGQQ